MEPLPPSESRRVLGRYELLAEIARGGMAVVYLARQVEPEVLGRPVVVKRLHATLATSASLVRGFLDEARTLTHVRHPNVVPILDVVEAKSEAFLVLEHVDAVSLATLHAAAIERDERVPVNVASRVMCDVLAGLHAAHEARTLRGAPLAIVHRDVSPQNVLVGADGVSRLIDFGIAKANVRDAATTGAVLKGKVGYFAPEQLQGLDVDRRVDVFAAGVVLHELLAGRRLFRGDDHATVMMRVLLDEIPELRTLRDDVTPELDAVLAKALDRDRESRFSDAATLLEALSAAAPPASAVEVARYVARLAGPRLDAERDELRALFAAPPRRRDRRNGWRRAVLAVFAVLAVVATGALVALASARGVPAASPDDAPAATPPTARDTPTALPPPSIAPRLVPPPEPTPTLAFTVSASAPARPPPPRPSARPSALPTTEPANAREATPPSPLHANPYRDASARP